MSAVTVRDPWARIEALEAENEALRHALGQHEQADQYGRLRAIGLRPLEATIALTLLARADHFCSRETMLLSIGDCRDGSERESDKIIDVALCRMRKRLPPGSIENAWNRGWRLTKVGADKLREALNG